MGKALKKKTWLLANITAANLASKTRRGKESKHPTWGMVEGAKWHESLVTACLAFEEQTQGDLDLTVQHIATYLFVFANLSSDKNLPEMFMVVHLVHQKDVCQKDAMKMFWSWCRKSYCHILYYNPTEGWATESIWSHLTLSRSQLLTSQVNHSS